MTAPKIHFIVGSTGAGKTTYAQRLAQSERALVFSIDTWMHNLFGADLAGSTDFAQIAARAQRARNQMWEIAEQALPLGVSIVFDTGLLTAADRAEARARARTLGVAQQSHYVATPVDIRWNRVSARNDRRDGGYMFEVTKPMFDFIGRIWQAPDADEIADEDFIVAGAEATA
jgi:predicted kinase